MLIIFLALIMITSIFSLFSYTLKYDSVNRIILNAPKEIFENSISLISYQETGKMYFDKPLLKKNYESYLDTQIYKYISKYHVQYLFYEKENSNLCSLDYNCQRVEIYFSTKISDLFNYEQKTFYEIKDNLHG